MRSSFGRYYKENKKKFWKEVKIMKSSGHRNEETAMSGHLLKGNDPRNRFFDGKDPNQEDKYYWNCDFVVYYVNGWPRIFVITNRNIWKGEELMAYYNGICSNLQKQFWRGNNAEEMDQFCYKIQIRQSIFFFLQ